MRGRSNKFLMQANYDRHTMLVSFVSRIICIIVLYAIYVSGDCTSTPHQFDNASNNLTGTDPYPEGMVVTYSCNSGFTMDSNSARSTCLNSQWTTEGAIECSEIYCGHVKTPNGGFLVNSPTYEVGSFYEFGCHEGYVMSGASQLLCRVDGEWNPSTAPTCTIVNCGEFGSVENGEAFQDNTYVNRNEYLSVTTVTCDRGYILNGNSEVACQSNGNWESKPACLPTDCGPYPGLNESQCVLNHEYSNNLLFIVCNNDDKKSGTRVGSSYSRCSDNEWSDTSMACICNCKMANMSSNIIEMKNLNEKGFLMHDQQLDWTCLNGTQNAIPNHKVICENGFTKVFAPDGSLLDVNDVNHVMKESDLCTLKTDHTDKPTGDDYQSDDYQSDDNQSDDNTDQNIIIKKMENVAHLVFIDIPIMFSSLLLSLQCFEYGL